MWGNNKTVTEKKSSLRQVGHKRENKLHKLTDTVRQTYIELENSNIIPQNRETTKITENDRWHSDLTQKFLI